MTCRLCLVKEEILIPVFDDCGSDAKGIAETVAKYVHVQLVPDDPVSTRICLRCWANIDHFHKFCQLVKERQLQLELPEKKKFHAATECETTWNAEIKMEEDAIYVDELDLEGDDSEKSNLICEPGFEDTSYEQESKEFENVTTNTTEEIMAKTNESHLDNPMRIYDANPLDEASLIASHTKLKCDVCLLEFATYNELRNHYRTVHNINGYAVCCRKTFYNRDTFIEHIHIHKNPDSVLKSSQFSLRCSRAWLYFTDLRNYKAKCNFCGKVMSYRGGGPYNLTRHTKSQHPIIFAAIRQDTNSLAFKNKRVTKSRESLSERTPTTFPEHMQSTNSSEFSPEMFGSTVTENHSSNLTPDYVQKSTISNKDRDELLTRYLLEFMSKNYLPLELVETKEFKNFVSELNCMYCIPTREELTNILVVTYYDIARKNVEQLLSTAEYVSISTDCWTSGPDSNYVAISGHFINKDTELQSVMLDCYKYGDKDTADQLREEFKKICDKWLITSKVVALTIDYAGTTRGAAVIWSDWTQIQCFANMLNLIVQAGLLEIRKTHAKFRAIAEMFHSDAVAAQSLHSLQVTLGQTPLKLKPDVPTRWSSTCDMFDMLIQLKGKLLTIITKDYSHMVNVNLEDFAILTAANELLSYFRNATQEMTSDSNFIISEVILIANALKNKCSQVLSRENLPHSVKKMGHRLLFELSKRYSLLEEDSMFAESTLLDPRFKRHGFTSETAYLKACTDLKDLVCKMPINTPPVVVTAVDDSKSPTPPKKSGSIWDEFDREVDKIINNSNPMEIGIMEVDKYLQEKILPRNNNPLKWWHEKREAYPHLYEIMRRRLCIAASSMPSENVFSKAGLTLIERRNRFFGRKVGRMMFLNANLW